MSKPTLNMSDAIDLILSSVAQLEEMRTDEIFENLVKDAGKYCRSDTNHADFFL